MRNHSRIRRIETALNRHAPGLIVVHSRDEAPEKIREFQKEYPGMALPTILVATRIMKPRSSGTGK